MGEQVLRLDEIEPLRLMVAIDGSEGSRKALLKAFGMAKEAVAYEIVVIYVIEVRDPSTMIAEVGKDRMAENANAVMDDATTIADNEGFVIKSEILEGHPAQAVLDYADGYGPDMIIVGSTGTNTSRSKTIGSVASAISKKAKHPVLVVQ